VNDKLALGQPGKRGHMKRQIQRFFSLEKEVIFGGFQSPEVRNKKNH
jgi:hypothetical protein